LELPPGSGAVEARLLAATKSDQTITADVIIAFTTLSGLGLGRWFQRLQGFTPWGGEHWFSTESQPQWTSQYFRYKYAYPIPEMQRLGGEAALCFELVEEVGDIKEVSNKSELS
jgi:hypothetical protein